MQWFCILWDSIAILVETVSDVSYVYKPNKKEKILDQNAIFHEEYIFEFHGCYVPS